MVASSNESGLLLAIEHDQAIGRLDLNGYKRAALRHVVSIGISVDPRLRRRGIGLALLSAGIEWSRARPSIRRVELEVHARNEPAIRLYEKFGFVYEGRQPKRLFKHGQYFDTLQMARLMLED